MKTEVLAGDHAIARAVELLRAGEIVALPTETVYGLAADAANEDAVAKIFEAKERPRFDPLIVHLPGAEWLERLAVIPPDDELISRLTSAFWPGPLTLVLPRRDVPDIVTAGLETVALRISAHPLFTQIAREFGRPLAAPSANRFGRISPTVAEHVREELNGRIPLVVDGGATEHGLESTIVAVEHGGLELLRRGPITAEQLAKFAEVRESESSAIRAPGQLPSHYAPRTPLIVLDKITAFQPGARRCGLLAWNPVPKKTQFAEVRKLSVSQDLREAAANLFRCMRELDGAQLDLIVAEAVPNEGLGRAIMDRLERAATR